LYEQTETEDTRVVSTPETPATTAPTVPTTTEPELTIPQEEIMEKITLSPITKYPAYILDQCGTLWGIPATLQGMYDRVKIDISKDDGSIIPVSEIDFFTLDGIIYLIHKYTTTDSAGATADAIDYYKQTGGVIEQVDTIPTKPVETRASYHGTRWLLETSVINCVECSYLYNLDAAMIEAQGNYGGKGAYMKAWPMVSGYVELDKGILVMTQDGALFWPVNRAAGSEVSEKGRLWK